MGAKGTRRHGACGTHSKGAFVNHETEIETTPEVNEFEEPMLLDTNDLTDVAGGCWLACQNGDCNVKPK